MSKFERLRERHRGTILSNVKVPDWVVCRRDMTWIGSI